MLSSLLLTDRFQRQRYAIHSHSHDDDTDNSLLRQVALLLQFCSSPQFCISLGRTIDSFLSLPCSIVFSLSLS